MKLTESIYRLRNVAIIVLLATLSSCIATQESTPPAAQSQASEPLASDPSQTSAIPTPAISPDALVMARPFDEALMNAAHMLFSLTELPKPGEKHLLVIDPLIDGVSGVQSVATRIIEARILELVRSKYPYFSPQPFNEANVRKSPLVLVGTLTAVNAQGQSSGVRQAYGICLALVDLKSGTVASKGTSHAQMQGVNHTPTPYFQESPAWMRESATEAYVNTCKASKPGDPVQTAYLDGLVASTLISEAISAYENGRYKEALNRYSSALDLPAGNQLRVYNGIYLTNLKLGRQGPATDAFGKIIDYGLAKKRLAVKFLFKPGTTAFMAEKQVSSFYPMWVREIAKRATQNNSCLEVVGHSSRSGPEPLNEKLSLLRAEYVKKKLEVEAPPLAKRTIAQGAGSRENLVGNGRDDLSDALDRRVVFQVINCKDSSQYY